MRTLWQDARYGTRVLLRDRGFTLIAVLTLATGIAASTAIFSVINALILSPPPIADADRVAALWRTPKTQRVEGFVSYPELEDWRARARSFESIAAYKTQGFTVIADGQAERVGGLRVTANFLSFLGVRVTGRDFRPEEERRGAEPVAILSHELWQSRFGGDKAVLDRPIALDGQSFTIVGVLPPDFDFPLAPNQAALITTISGEDQNLDERGAQVLRMIGRVKRGVTLADAQREVTAIAAALEDEYPAFSRTLTVYLVPIDQQIVGPQVRQAIWVLFGAVSFLLLIACTNVANLLLVRAGARRNDLALRFALGANAWRVSRQVLTENLVLALVSGGAGVLGAAWGLAAMRHYGAAQLPRLDEVRMDIRVLAFAVGASLLTAAIVSLLPVLKASRPDLNDVLKAGAKGVTSGGGMRAWRNALVILEVALALVLLIGAGLMMRSFGRLVNVSPGFDAEDVLVGRVNLPRGTYSDPQLRQQYVDDVLERLEALTGVEGAAFVAPMPFSGGNVAGSFSIAGQSGAEPGQQPAASLRSVTAGYFQLLGIPLRAGRDFNDADRRGRAGAAVINESLARRYFGDVPPVGQRLRDIGVNQNPGDPDEYEIVGVVGDIRHGSLTTAPQPEIYLPFRQNSWSFGHFLVRAPGEDPSLARRFTDAIRAGDRMVPVLGVQPLVQAIAGTVAQPRFYTFLFAVFGATALLLTLTGIYGVISYSVSQQTREIGIRMALGAPGRLVLGRVLTQGLALTVLGAGLGLAGAVAVTHLMRTLLFELSPTDPLVFTGVTAGLIATALVACYFPARRAAGADPLVALRHD